MGWDDENHEIKKEVPIPRLPTYLRSFRCIFSLSTSLLFALVLILSLVCSLLMILLLMCIWSTKYDFDMKWSRCCLFYFIGLLPISKAVKEKSRKLRSLFLIYMFFRCTAYATNFLQIGINFAPFLSTEQEDYHHYRIIIKFSQLHVLAW